VPVQLNHTLASGTLVKAIDILLLFINIIIAIVRCGSHLGDEVREHAFSFH
jgi:hypothetical protein